MQKIKTFFHVFVNSLFPLEGYYKKIPKTRFSFSLRYWVVFIIVLHGIFASIFFVKTALINKSLHKLNEKLMEMLGSYPSDLVIRIKEARVLTNYDRPYIMWFDFNKFPTPVLAVDEFASAEKIREYRAYILLHDGAVTLRNPNTNTIATYPLPKNNEYTITKNRVTLMQNTLLDSLSVRLTLIVLAGYIGITVLSFLGFIVSKFVYLAVFSAVAYLIIKHLVKKHTLHYKKILQIALHASTLPLIFEYMVITAKLNFSFARGGFFISSFPVLLALLSIVYGAFLIAGIYEGYHKKNPASHHHR